MLHEQHPVATVQAFAGVEVELLLHASGRHVVDDVFVAEPHPFRHAALPLGLIGDGFGIGVIGFLLEIDMPVVAHSRGDPASVALVDVFIPDGAVVGTGDAHHAPPVGARVIDSLKIHGDFHVAPLIDQRRIMDVHAGHVAADGQDTLSVHVERRVAMVRIEPFIVGIVVGETARHAVIPLGGPVFAARKRGIKLADPKGVKPWFCGPGGPRRGDTAGLSPLSRIPRRRSGAARLDCDTTLFGLTPCGGASATPARACLGQPSLGACTRAVDHCSALLSGATLGHSAQFCVPSRAGSTVHATPLGASPRTVAPPVRPRCSTQRYVSPALGRTTLGAGGAAHSRLGRSPQHTSRAIIRSRLRRTAKKSNRRQPQPTE